MSVMPWPQPSNNGTSMDKHKHNHHHNNSNTHNNHNSIHLSPSPSLSLSPAAMSAIHPHPDALQLNNGINATHNRHRHNQQQQQHTRLPPSHHHLAPPAKPIRSLLPRPIHHNNSNDTNNNNKARRSLAPQQRRSPQPWKKHKHNNFGSVEHTTTTIASSTSTSTSASYIHARVPVRTPAHPPGRHAQSPSSDGSSLDSRSSSRMHATARRKIRCNANQNTNINTNLNAHSENTTTNTHTHMHVRSGGARALGSHYEACTKRNAECSSESESSSTTNSESESESSSSAPSSCSSSSSSSSVQKSKKKKSKKKNQKMSDNNSSSSSARHGGQKSKSSKISSGAQPHRRSHSRSKARSKPEHSRDHTHTHTHSFERSHRERHDTTSTSTASKTTRKGADVKKLAITRNLMLTGQFKFDTLSEDAMRTALQGAFDCDAETMTVAFYKYGVRLHGHTYRKHIHCISVTFATAQLCHAKLAQFVAGDIDVSAVGEACAASLDEQKARATALYRKYRTRMQQMKRDVHLSDDDDEDEDDDVDTRNENEKHSENCGAGGGVYALPLPLSPLQFFKRPEVPRPQSQSATTKVIETAGATKYTKSTPAEHMYSQHTRSMPPMPGARAGKQPQPPLPRSMSDAENAVRTPGSGSGSGNASASGVEKSGKSSMDVKMKMKPKTKLQMADGVGDREFESLKIPKISKIGGKQHINLNINTTAEQKHAHAQSHSRAAMVKQEISEPPTKRRKLRANDMALSRKKKLTAPAPVSASSTSTSMKSEDKTTLKPSLSLQKKTLEDAKKMSVKIKVGKPTPKSSSDAQSQSVLQTQAAKPRTKLRRKETNTKASASTRGEKGGKTSTLKRVKSPQSLTRNNVDNDDVDGSDTTDVKMKDGGDRGEHPQPETQSWRTYVSLYAMYGNRDSLARLHFECLQTFKQQLIEQCVHAELIRICTTERAKKPRTKMKRADIETHTHTHTQSVSIDSSHPSMTTTTCDDAHSSSSSDKKTMVEADTANDDTLKTPQSPLSLSQSQPVPVPPLATNSANTTYPLFLGVNFNAATMSTPLPFMSMPSSMSHNPLLLASSSMSQPPPPTIASTVMANKSIPLSSSASNRSDMNHLQPMSVAYARNRGTATELVPPPPPSSSNTLTAPYIALPTVPTPQYAYVYPTTASNTPGAAPFMYASSAFAPFVYADPHKLPLPISELDTLSFPNFMLSSTTHYGDTQPSHSLKMAAPLPHFDLAAHATSTKHYSDTVSSLSNTSNVTNLTCSSSMAPSSITSSFVPFVGVPSSASMAIKSAEAHNRSTLLTTQTPLTTQTQPQRATVHITDDSDTDTATDRLVSEPDITSKNGQWIIRAHATGCARTQGHYTLSPVNKQKKFRHLGHSQGQHHARVATESSVSNMHSSSSSGNARHLRANQRRLRSAMKESHSHQSLTASKMNALRCRPKNIQFGKSSIHSWGVFALEEIAAEEMVVEYIGEYIQEKLANLREKLYAKQGYDDYMFRVDDHLIIDATKKGNLARFINHSCDPNCFTRVVHVHNTPRIVIYSKRQIKPGEELTYDYKFPIEEDKIPCLCGSKNCRGTLN